MTSPTALRSLRTCRHWRRLSTISGPAVGATTGLSATRLGKASPDLTRPADSAALKSSRDRYREASRPAARARQPASRHATSARRPAERSARRRRVPERAHLQVCERGTQTPTTQCAGRSAGVKRTNAGRPLRRSSRVAVCGPEKRLRSAEWPSAAGKWYPAEKLTDAGQAGSIGSCRRPRPPGRIGGSDPLIGAGGPHSVSYLRGPYGPRS